MTHRRTGEVMIAPVVSVAPGTLFKEVAELLDLHGISGVPVVGPGGRVLGVLSQTDLLAHQAEQADQEDQEERRPRRTSGRRWNITPAARARRAKAAARTAERLMSSPAVTVHPDDSVVEAARTMARHRVERLPVVDSEGRLVGIVARRDLLRLFLRSDEAIRAEVVDEVLVRTLCLVPNAVGVGVHEGVVTLEGQLPHRSQVAVAVRMAAQVDGVVGVDDRLGYALDDTHLHLDQQTQGWLHRL